MSEKHRLTPLERRVATTLGAVIALRMMGLFMLLPVLSLYADKLPGATPLLIGVAIGIYGLTQAGLQIPMGRWSDRIGRKPVITIGLAVFTAGALLAASVNHIFVVILGRALQGGGAIAGATLALASDLTREEQRTKVMAIIGMSIGAAFSIALVVGPMLDAWLGLRGLFLVAAGFSSASIVALWLWVPTPESSHRSAASDSPQADRMADHPALRALQLGVFYLHFILAANFVSIPQLLVTDFGLDSAHHYFMYLPVISISMLAVGPMIMMSTKTALGDHWFRGSILLITLAELLMCVSGISAYGFAAILCLFFIGFNFLEASLPSMVSKLAGKERKGSALGGYATLQFLGIFAGGLVGGAVANYAGYHAVFYASSALAVFWLLQSTRQSFQIDKAAPSTL